MSTLHSIAVGVGALVILGTPNANASAWIEQNLGQAAEPYDFVVRAHGITGFISAYGMDLYLQAAAQIYTAGAGRLPAEESDLARRAEQPRVQVTRLRLLGANVDAQPQSVVRNSGRSHYLRGSDVDAWLPDVPHLTRVV